MQSSDQIYPRDRDCRLGNSYIQPRHCVYPPKVNTDNSSLKNTSIIRSDIALDVKDLLDVRLEKPDSRGRGSVRRRAKNKSTSPYQGSHSQKLGAVIVAIHILRCSQLVKPLLISWAEWSSTPALSKSIPKLVEMILTQISSGPARIKTWKLWLAIFFDRSFMRASISDSRSLGNTNSVSQYTTPLS